MPRLVLAFALVLLSFALASRPVEAKRTNVYRKGDIGNSNALLFWYNSFFLQDGFILGGNLGEVSTPPFVIGESFPIGLRFGIHFGTRINAKATNVSSSVMVGLSAKMSLLNLSIGNLRPYLFIGNHSFLLEEKDPAGKSIRSSSWFNPMAGIGLSYFFNDAVGLTMEAEGIQTSLGATSTSIVPAVSLGLSIVWNEKELKERDALIAAEEQQDSPPSASPSPSLAPEDPEPHYEKALVLMGQGDYEAAVKEFEEVLRIKPDYPLIHSRINEAKEKHKKWLSNKALEYFEKATKLYNKKQFAAAIAEYEEVLKLTPDDVDAHFGLAEACMEDKDCTGSTLIKHYREAARLNPERALFRKKLVDALVSRGNAFFNVDEDTDGDENGIPDKLERAIEAYTEAVEVGDSAFAHNGLGNVYHALGRIDSAIEQYKEAIRINPKNAAFYYNLGLILDENDRSAEAIEAYKQSLRLDPKDADAWNNLGVSFFKMKKYREAISAYQKALQVNPRVENSKQNLVNARNELENLTPNYRVIGNSPSSYAAQMKRILYRSLHDPYTAEYFDWSKPVPIKKNGEWYWTVTFSVRAKNAMGAFVCCSHYRLYIRKDRIVDYEKQDDEESAGPSPLLAVVMPPGQAPMPIAIRQSGWGGLAMPRALDGLALPQQVHRPIQAAS